MSSFLSPIHDYSDFAFRLLCQKYGCEFTCVPLVNVMSYSKMKTQIDAKDIEKNLGIQFVGNNPNDLDLSLKRLSDENFYVKWINLNCGCPSIRTMESGGGSALLKHPKLILECVKRMKRTSFLVSIKIRIDENFKNTLKLVKDVQNEGADFIIVHGRSAKQGYSGKNDWEAIKKIKGIVDIPIIGNGDILSANEGKQKISEGFCDGFMIARSAMSNPMVFSNLIPNPEKRFNLLLEYLKIYQKYDEPSLKDVKMKAIFFIRNMVGAPIIRDRLSRTKKIEDIIALLHEDEFLSKETNYKQF